MSLQGKPGEILGELAGEGATVGGSRNGGLIIGGGVGVMGSGLSPRL